MPNLSPHFTLEEMTASQEAARRGINNEPSDEILANLRATCAKLEAVRELLARPMIVSSGYRCRELNAAIGGAKDSAHIDGFAVDFFCPGFGSPLQVCRGIENSGIPYDQVIHEFGRWTHISFHPGVRQMTLSIFKSSDGYLPGPYQRDRVIKIA